jgi:hypothetical protein
MHAETEQGLRIVGLELANFQPDTLGVIPAPGVGQLAGSAYQLFHIVGHASA